MSDTAKKIEALNTILNASLAGTSPTMDLAAVLGMLEAQRATGIFRAREGASMQCKFYLRFADGRIVKVMGGATAVDVIAQMLRSKELYWNFKSVPNRPNGDIDESLTGLLLEAMTQLDHDVRDAADGPPSITENLSRPPVRMGAQLRLVTPRREAG